MTILRVIFIALAALLFATPALAAEEIRSFDVGIEVQKNGDIIVTETIVVNAEGNAIRRGIFRDLPRFYERDGANLRYDYNVQRVTRDGRSEDYETETEDNAYRIRIGDPDVFLDIGEHTYVIRYRVKNQVRYFEDHDEIYWNATGNYWAFDILSARATVTLPPGAQITDESGYTGGHGETGADYKYGVEGERHVWQTTRPLDVREGLTISLSFAKGLIDPPSQWDRFSEWWDRYGGLAILGGWLVLLLGFLFQAFQRVGRDPLKGPVFPRYEAPAGYSPAAAHQIYYRGVQGHRALIATLMNLAVKGRIKIDATDKKKTTLTRSDGPLDASGIAPEDLTFETTLFAASRSKTLGEKYDATFTAAYTSFIQKLGQRYGREYFRWNFGYTLPALFLSMLVFLLVAASSVSFTWWHGLGLIALTAINLLAMYFMPAPTKKGQQIRTEIEGLRLYMEKAEALQLNSVDVLAKDRPPPMTKERYERFLPYAVALGVEDPWTKHFEKLIPEEAADYHPTWTNLSGSRSLAAISGALVANMSSGVTSAMPQSSSSSGGGGGGFSGGGGGGGGGGGW